MPTSKLELKLVPYLQATSFPGEVDGELNDHDITTHYESDGVYLDWDDDEMPVTKAWLLDAYGEVARNHRYFAIAAT